MPVTRPVQRHGRFAGVATLALSPQYLSDALARQQVSAKDVIALFHADGSYLARSTDLGRVLGRQIAQDRPFMQPGVASEGQFRQVAQMDLELGRGEVLFEPARHRPRLQDLLLAGVTGVGQGEPVARPPEQGKGFLQDRALRGAGDRKSVV